MLENPYNSPQAQGCIVERSRTVRWRLALFGLLVTWFGATAGAIALRETMRGVLVQNYYHGEYSSMLMRTAEVAAVIPGAVMLLVAFWPLAARLRGKASHASQANPHNGPAQNREDDGGHHQRPGHACQPTV
jgi:hypothetical protein